jgi:hypothetical protein
LTGAQWTVTHPDHPFASTAALMAGASPEALSTMMARNDSPEDERSAASDRMLSMVRDALLYETIIATTSVFMDSWPW